MKKIIILALLLSGCAGGATYYDPNYPMLRSSQAGVAESSYYQDSLRQRRSEALLNFGAQMLNNSQPQPIYAPSQTVCRQQGIYTYCNQY